MADSNNETHRTTEVSLGELRQLLAQLPSAATAAKGFTHPHSWRGIYAEVAFEPASNVVIGEMVRAVDAALTDEFTGHKGGEFRYAVGTTAHLSLEGTTLEYDWAPVLDSVRKAGPLLETTSDAPNDWYAALGRPVAEDRRQAALELLAREGYGVIASDMLLTVVCREIAHDEPARALRYLRSWLNGDEALVTRTVAKLCVAPG